MCQRCIEAKEAMIFGGADQSDTIPPITNADELGNPENDAAAVEELLDSISGLASGTPREKSDDDHIYLEVSRRQARLIGNFLARTKGFEAVTMSAKLFMAGIIGMEPDFDIVAEGTGDDLRFTVTEK